MSAAEGVGSPENDRRRRQLQCPPDDLARIDRGVVNRTGLLHLFADEAVFLVEEEDAKLFDFLEGHRRAAVVDHCLP